MIVSMWHEKHTFQCGYYGICKTNIYRPNVTWLLYFNYPSEFDRTLVGIYATPELAKKAAVKHARARDKSVRDHD